MPILNFQHFYYLNDSDLRGLQFRQSSGITHMLHKHPRLEDRDYWYIEIGSADAIYSIFTVIPTNKIKELQRGNLTLIICNTHEAFHKVVEPIYQIAINKFGISEDNLLVISESADINDEITRVSKLYGKQPIHAVWSRVFEKNIHTQVNFQIGEGKAFDTLQPKHYDKKFINFNRRWRPQRPTFVGLLSAIKLLDKGYVSLARSDCGNTWPTAWETILSFNPREQCEELYDLLVSNRETILNLPELYLDTEELIENKAELRRGTDQYYQNTYFSVVGETNFYTNYPVSEPGRFFSEKIFKPIAEKHPFILINPPNSLPLLRDLGYKTFHPFINESYDQELNDSKRLMMIARETERLSNFTDQEVLDFLNNVREICEHNHNCIKNKVWEKDFLTFLPRPTNE